MAAPPARCQAPHAGRHRNALHPAPSARHNIAMIGLSRWLLTALTFLFVIVAATGAAVWWLASSATPAQGRWPLAGLTAPVEVIRDQWGVPHIFAASEVDAAAALGWVHAEDRMAQMEAMRRTGSGRLAEVIGPTALPSDRWMRTLGLYDLAQRQYPRLSEQTRAVLEAYARGVNAWLNGRAGALPPEYTLLGVGPEPWTVADSLVWLKLMALRLSVDQRDELLRARLARRLTPEQLAALWPEDADTPTTISSKDLKALLDDRMLAGTLAAMPDADGASRGASNVWVVSDARTNTGGAILANDPHLPFALPGPWYLVHIETPEGTLAGATSPGFPGLVFGHNGTVAWGLTTSNIDAEDIFVERIDVNDPGHYLTPDGPQPFAAREEHIAVRGQNPEILPVRVTRHGPVISDLAGLPDAVGASTGAPASSAVVLALATTALIEDDRTADALLDLARARSADDVLAAAATATAPQQNLFYADGDGHIGFVSAGRIPIRPEGTGWLPVEGWTGDHDWQGFMPFPAQPQLLDPPSGLIINANNRPAPADWPYPIIGAWDAGFRAARLRDVLTATKPQTIASSAALQQDTVSMMARRLLPLMLAGLPPQPEDSPASRTVALLAGWNGEMRVDAPQPLLFASWLRELVRVIAADELGPAFAEYWDYRPIFVANVLSGDPAWCDDITTPAVETCADALQTALQAALADLGGRLGPDPGAWQWGDLHHLRMQNILWSRAPLLGKMLGVQRPIGGGNDTPMRAASRIADLDEPFTAIHGASFRAIYDLADLAASRFIIVGGQSGNPFSAHWTDLVDLWMDGGGLTLSGDRESLRRQAEARLLLVPQSHEGL